MRRNLNRKRLSAPIPTCAKPCPIPSVRKIQPSPSVRLQRILGNQGFQHHLQPKLRIGQSNDQYEQEADRVADQVLRMPDKPEFRDRRLEIREGEETVQAKSRSNKGGRIAPAIESGINSLRGSGQPMPESTRTFFESRFGADFGGVKVHSGTSADHLAESINAKAFTIGKDVVFGHGQYSPESSRGKQLLAHELTHVVQQNKMSNGSKSDLSNTGTKPPSNLVRNLKKTFVNKSSEQRIQRDCRNFNAGWIHPSTGRPGPAGTWCATEVEARARAIACPPDCFIYNDGPDSHPYREIPGFPCAHYVAHQLNIRTGARYARCRQGFSVTIGQLTQGRQDFPLNQAQVNDIWSNGRHSGVVIRVDVANNRVRISACDIGGNVYSAWHNDGRVYR